MLMRYPRAGPRGGLLCTRIYADGQVGGALRNFSSRYSAAERATGTARSSSGRTNKASHDDDDDVDAAPER